MIEIKMPEEITREPFEDCIDRQAVNVLIDELARAISDERCFMSRGRSTANIMQDILDLPSVQSTRPTGKWMFTVDGNTDHITCSVCGRDSISNFDYCPNCGCYNGGEMCNG